MKVLLTKCTFWPSRAPPLQDPCVGPQRGGCLGTLSDGYVDPQSGHFVGPRSCRLAHPRSGCFVDRHSAACLDRRWQSCEPSNQQCSAPDHQTAAGASIGRCASACQALQEISWLVAVHSCTMRAGTDMYIHTCRCCVCEGACSPKGAGRSMLAGACSPAGSSVPALSTCIGVEIAADESALCP